MYHRSYEEVASITISSPGPEEGEVRNGRAGPRRSKNGARLRFTTADGAAIHELNPTFAPDHEIPWKDDPRGNVHLIDPTITDVEEAVAEATEYMRFAREAGRWSGGGIEFFYSGHGAPGTGALVLRDGELTASELVEIVGSRVSAGDDRRGIGLILDSCYSGAFMAHLVATAFSRGSRVIPRDMLVGSLHNELAWELPHLGHGALTYSHLARHEYVDQQYLARVVAENEDALIRAALCKHVPNPVTYLTDGDQHSIDVVNGHAVEVLGGGHFDLADVETVVAEQVMDALERAVLTPDGEAVRFP